MVWLGIFTPCATFNLKSNNDRLGNRYFTSFITMLTPLLTFMSEDELDIVVNTSFRLLPIIYEDSVKIVAVNPWVVKEEKNRRSATNIASISVIIKMASIYS